MTTAIEESTATLLRLKVPGGTLTAVNDAKPDGVIDVRLLEGEYTPETLSEVVDAMLRARNFAMRKEDDGDRVVDELRLFWRQHHDITDRKNREIRALREQLDVARAGSNPRPERTEAATPCAICGDPEPTHAHDRNGERIDNYFTVGRGESDFDAALRWRQRAEQGGQDG